MNPKRRTGVLLGLLATSVLSLSGCAGAVIGGAAGGALVVAQERTVGTVIDDAALQLQINEAMFRDDHALFGAVDLTVTAGQVVMTGTVPTQDARVAAARHAWSVDGVNEVINELQVGEDVGISDRARDEWITTQLRGRMLADGDVRDVNYSLNTVNGVIYVMGVARTRAELQRVLGHAREIQYVQRVVSHARIAGAAGG